MKVICGTNFSVHSEKTARAASEIAVRMGIPMLLVHVVDPNLYRDKTHGFLAGVQRNREEKLKRLAESIRSSGVVIKESVIVGTPAIELARLAENEAARLIVLPQVGAIAPAEWAAGSVADKVIQISPVPTLVLRDPRRVDSWLNPEGGLKVLAAFDFSRAARAALAWVADLGGQLRCDVTVAYIASQSNPLARNGWPLPASKQSAGVIRGLIERQVESVFGPAAPSVRCVVDASLFWAGGRCLEIAEDAGADLIAVGAGSRQGWSRLGSFGRMVVHSSRTNVVTVPQCGSVSRSECGDRWREAPVAGDFERAKALAA